MVEERYVVGWRDGKEWNACYMRAAGLAIENFGEDMVEHLFTLRS